MLAILFHASGQKSPKTPDPTVEKVTVSSIAKPGSELTTTAFEPSSIPETTAAERTGAGTARDIAGRLPAGRSVAPLM